MGIDRMYWLDEAEHRRLGFSGHADANGGYDIHVVIGATSRALRGEIVLVDSAAGRVFTIGGPHPVPAAELISLRFVPRFRAESVSADGKTITGHGVQIEVDSGQVTAAAPTAAVRVHNFLLEAIAVVKDTAAPSGHRTLPPLRVRIHVHDRVVRAWLTPSPLTAYRGAVGQRFTVLAELATDGQPGPPLIGDLTRQPGLTWTSAAPATVAIESNGDITVAVPSEDPTPVCVKVKLPAAWGGAVAAGHVLGRLGFHEQPTHTLQARLVSGPGSARLAEVPNVLFLPDGFTADQQGDWDHLVTDLVDTIGHTRAFRPFDLFLSESSINVWALFLPSREQGMSPLFELFAADQPPPSLLKRAASILSLDVPGPADTWDLRMLFEEAGLPMRSDEPPVALDDADEAGKLKRRQAYERALARWQTIYGAAQVPAAKATKELWGSWASAYRRTLADECDTAFALSLPRRPHLDVGDTDIPQFHPYRVQRDDLNQLLAGIQDGDGPVIGHVWAPPPTTPSPSRPEAGKDRFLVYVLLSGASYRGIESDHEFVTSTIHRENGVLVEIVDTPHRYRVKPHALPRNLWGGAKMGALNRRTVVHELAHSFRLQDEYTDVVGALPPARHADLLDKGNIQPEAELADAAGKYVGDRLRWRWPRIARAGVLSDPPVDLGNGDVMLPLRFGHKHRFKNGDVVFLRQRPLVRRPASGQPQVLMPAKVSGPLTVVSDSQVGQQIVVHGGPVDPAEFPAIPPFESIVFIPVPAPAYAVGDQAAELVPRLVRDHINNTGLPLNRTAGQTCAVLPSTGIEGTAARSLLANVPAHSEPFWVTAQWVGAFDGGVRYGCGVVHPSPACLMNASAGDTVTFCPVCAYLLVDAVDPALHGEIDREYALGYVEPRP